MTTTHPPKREDDAVPPAFEDDDIRMTKSARDALAAIADEPVPPKPRAPANPGFRFRSWR